MGRKDKDILEDIMDELMGRLMSIVAERKQVTLPAPIRVTPRLH